MEHFPRDNLRVFGKVYVVPPDILGIMDAEERKFLELLDKFDKIVPRRLSAQDAFKWRTEKGAPLEMVEDRCDDPREFRALMDAERDASRSASKMSKEIFGKGD